MSENKENKLLEFANILKNIKGSEFEIAIGRAARNIYANSCRIDDYTTRKLIFNKFKNWKQRIKREKQKTNEKIRKK